MAERQLAVLDDTSAAIDGKASTIVGFMGVILALALQLGLAEGAGWLDRVLFWTASGLLLSGIVLLVLSMAPKWRRLDPDPEVLVDKYWDLDFETTRRKVTSNLADVWIQNRAVHKRKVRLFESGLWVAVSGLVLLAIDVLTVRAPSG